MCYLNSWYWNKKNKQGGFFDVLAVTLGASLLGNLSAGKRVIKAGEGAVRADEGTITAGQNF